jgi:bifunctional DNA-binding transcriptional regulator/antitoxin component of YhaV-PrlF toxin-antitoxin module
MHSSVVGTPARSTEGCNSSRRYGSDAIDPAERRAEFGERIRQHLHWRHRIEDWCRVGDARRDPDILLFGKTTITIQVRGRRTLTLPAALREKYRLGEGDPLTVVDLDGAILLSPKVLVVPRLAAEMERLRRARKLSLKDLGGPAPED